MTALADFITRRICEAVQTSAAAGKAKYTAYFVNTTLYAAHREDVDTALQVAGRKKVIIKQ